MPNEIKVIAFDVFNTVFRIDGVPREELKAYAEHISKKPWSPLTLPRSWRFLPAHVDAQEGLRRLRKKYTVVTCSNGPVDLLKDVSAYNQIIWDAYIDIAANKVFKPGLAAYMTICQQLQVDPIDVMMVTANKDFGDLEGADKVGMTPQLIRHPGEPANLIALAEMMSC